MAAVPFGVDGHLTSQAVVAPVVEALEASDGIVSVAVVDRCELLHPVAAGIW